MRKFCKANGVASSTFHKWRSALAARGAVTDPVTVNEEPFHPVIQSHLQIQVQHYLHHYWSSAH